MMGGTLKLLIAVCLLGLTATILALPDDSAPPTVPYRLAEVDNAWVSQTLKGMSLRDKIGQLIQVRVPGKFLNRRSQEFREIEHEILQNHVGGVVLFAGNVYESAWLLNDLQSRSRLPLLVAADFERGASFRVTDTTSFPWTMAIGATGSEDFAYQEGVVTAREARALGVHWIFAPVLDVNNNPDNPVINIRSFGEDPQLVARLGAAFIRGARANGVLTTGKHFPGHGDTTVDSHIALPVVASDRQRLDAIELVPFRSAIAAGVDAIMTAHLAVPQITGDPGLPATLSSSILTQLLRHTLNFQGLIVTDALEMGGIANNYWSGLAAVRALQAGADLLLLPLDAAVAIDEVERAVKRGDIAETRLDESVAKILSAKTRLELHLKRTVPVEAISELVAAPENELLAREMADHSITLVKDESHLIPIDPRLGKQIFSLVIASELDPNPAPAFQSEMRRRFLNVQTAGVDTRTPDDVVAGIMQSAAKADLIVCATLVRLVTGSGRISLAENQRRLLEKIFDSGKPVIWVAFGNPYMLRLHPASPNYLCTFSYSDVSQIAAARALSGAIPIQGRMPISIPGQCKVGDGLQLPLLDMTLRLSSAETPRVSPDAFAETIRVLSSFVEQGVFPGASLTVGYRESIVLSQSVGRLDPSPAAPAVTPSTLYDLGSLSKSVGTTWAAMILTESGRLLLNAPVQDFLPEFRGPNKDRMKVRDLLTHVAGLQRTWPESEAPQTYSEAMKWIYAAPLEKDRPAQLQDEDLGMILLGEIVARAAGHPLDQFLTEHLFEPLGMKSTLYRPSKELLGRIALTEVEPLRFRLSGSEVQGEQAWRMGGVSGHAGLFSTAGDLAVFAQTLLNRGIYDHRRYLRPDTIALFTSGQGLGWTRPSSDDPSGRILSSGAFWNCGSTGASLWIDPHRHLFIVLLANAPAAARADGRLADARRAIIAAITGVIDRREEAASPQKR
jgi:beta-N-acetylhexosaminidase